MIPSILLLVSLTGLFLLLFESGMVDCMATHFMYILRVLLAIGIALSVMFVFVQLF